MQPPTELATALAPIYGQWVTIRPIRPDDIDIETAFLAGLSEATRYNRFHGAGVQPDAAAIRRLTTIDYACEMALVATVMLDGAEQQVGVARYVRDADGARAEFAIVVADAWQGCGLGTRLLRALADYARRQGLHTLVGDVLATNTPMFALAQRLDGRLLPHPDAADLRRVEIDL